MSSSPRVSNIQSTSSSPRPLLAVPARYPLHSSTGAVPGPCLDIGATCFRASVRADHESILQSQRPGCCQFGDSDQTLSSKAGSSPPARKIFGIAPVQSTTLLGGAAPASHSMPEPPAQTRSGEASVSAASPATNASADPRSPAGLSPLRFMLVDVIGPSPASAIAATNAPTMGCPLHRRPSAPSARATPEANE